MAMQSTITFQKSDSGMQTGINNGTINAQFNLPTDPLDKLPIANGAEFDSYLNQHEDECLPGTRTGLLDEIAKWAVSPHAKCIFWLNGMAGTGKSTIARTVAKHFKQEKILGASFFFKRGEGDRGNAMKLFPTITRQLAKSIPQLTPGVQNAISGNSDIGSKGMREQFDKLLLQPLLDLNSSSLPIFSVVIVIDALDECDVDNDIWLMLQLLQQLKDSEVLRLRVLLTSRPELPIRLGFKKLAHYDYEDLVLHGIPKEAIEHDLLIFMNCRLSEIREERDPPLPINWPGVLNIQKLVALSVPLFIFAATICRILKDPNWDPLDSLTEILTHQKDESKLDSTYLPVLDRLLNRQTKNQKKDLVQKFHQVVGIIVILESPLSVISLSKLIGLPERLIHLRLNLLHSVLRIPNDESLPVQLFHLSFRDFLLDPHTRSKTPLWVDEKEMHHRLARHCLVMCQKLRRNICGLLSDGTQRSEIDSQIIDHYLSPELQYACRYWARHLVQCTGLNSMMHDALLFLQKHFLHWMEALSILGLASEVVGIINLLQAAKLGDDDSLIVDFLHDAKRFVLRNFQIADEVPLQIYCAGLVFAPQTSIIRTEFKLDLPSWICQLPQVNERWSAELQTLEGHSDSVHSVAFSPDGRVLASGSADETVRLWDTATGGLQQTLEGHSLWVDSVAFSPDSRVLASGSADNTVRLWDTATGGLQQTLKGHSHSVLSVAFSPDGRRLASSSDDNTVRLWDTATGGLQQTLEGHSHSVLSVAFSPDGRRLASGSADNTVRLWDTATGGLQQTLEGHSRRVLSVAFSPDGQLLASGSDDNTIRLWDIATGSLQQTFEGYSESFSSNHSDIVSLSCSDSVSSVAFSPNGHPALPITQSGSRTRRREAWSRLIRAIRARFTRWPSRPTAESWRSVLTDKSIRPWDIATGSLQQEGHSDSVSSVAFSPNGRLLASGSEDNTVRLWDIATGSLQQTFKGHSYPVHSVAFSPNGQVLASSSTDQTVRLWDTAIGGIQQAPKGHSESIDSMAFSPDGQVLASGSWDNKVRLWDTATGSLQQTLKGHSHWVHSVAFSPNGRRLASGSADNTVRLWDTATGGLQYTLEGHSQSIRLVAFSPNSRLLVSISYENIVRLWDTATGGLQQTLQGHSGSVLSVAFSPDSRRLASSSEDNTVRLWDTATGGLQQTLQSHSGSVKSVAFSPNGRLLASGSEDNTVRLWDMATGGLQEILYTDASVDKLEFSQDGSYLNTNLGALEFQPGHENRAFNSTHMNPTIFIDQGQWINLNGNNVLWLPPDFRPSCFAINGYSLALGHRSGRISFLRFC